MTSKLHPRFRRDLAALPVAVQRRARRSFERFKADPSHPGLEFKPVGTTQPIWSARVSDNYRVVGLRTGDEILWFFVGTHAAYDRLLATYGR